MVIFLFGEDTFRSQEKVRQLRQKFQNEVDSSGSSLTIIEGKDVDLAYVRKVVLAPALFAKKRFVLFKNFLQTSPSKELQADVVSLLREYASKNDDNIIVFWESAAASDLRNRARELFKFLNRQKFSQEFEPLDNRDLKKWVIKNLADQQTKIEADALAFLLELVGDDMWRLYNEVEKLKSYKFQQTITVADVKLLTVSSFRENVYYLLDLILRKDKERAVLFLGKILNSQLPFEDIFNLLKWQASTLSIIKGALADGVNGYLSIAKQTKLHPFVVKKNLSYVQRMTVREIINFLDKTSELQWAFRKQKAPGKVLLTRYVLSLMD